MSGPNHDEPHAEWCKAWDCNAGSACDCQRCTPTRERVATLLWNSADDGGRPEWTWEYLTERADRGEGDYADIRAEYYEIAELILALFSHLPPSIESARILDMASGTTFVARYNDASGPDVFVRVTAGRWHVLRVRDLLGFGLDDIDQSTIRDVTQPPVVSA